MESINFQWPLMQLFFLFFLRSSISNKIAKEESRKMVTLKTSKLRRNVYTEAIQIKYGECLLVINMKVFVYFVYLNFCWLFISATLSLTACLKSSWPAISLVTIENCCQLYRTSIESIAATWCSRLGANCSCSRVWDCLKIYWNENFWN